MSQESPTFEEPQNPESMAQILTEKEEAAAERSEGTKKKAWRAARSMTKLASTMVTTKNSSEKERTEQMRELMGEEEDPSTTTSKDND